MKLGCEPKELIIALISVMIMSPVIIFVVLIILVEPEPEVPWWDYHPVVRERLDTYSNNKDCEGFKRQYDTSERNSRATWHRTGPDGIIKHPETTQHGNEALMKYISFYAAKSGC